VRKDNPLKKNLKVALAINIYYIVIEISESQNVLKHDKRKLKLLLDDFRKINLYYIILYYIH